MDWRIAGPSLLLLLSTCCAGWAAEAAPNSKEELARARQRLPVRSLQGPYRAAALEVLQNAVLYRRGAVEVFPCEPRLLDWLIDHPTVVAQMWQQLGVPVCPIEATADGFLCRDEDRASLHFHTVYRGEQFRIVYCVAEVRRPLARTPLAVRFVLVHRLRFSRQPDGRYFAIQQLEGFAATDGVALQTLMKLSRTAWSTSFDRALADLSVYFAAIARILQHRPQWGTTVLARLGDAIAETEAAELRQLLATLPSPPPELLPAAFAELLPASNE